MIKNASLTPIFELFLILFNTSQFAVRDLQTIP